MHKMNSKRSLHHYLLLTAIAIVASDVRFVCPPPDSNIGEKVRTDTMHTACLSDGHDFDHNHMDLTPGMMTVRFESTAIHEGSPFRISLHKYHKRVGDESCVLRDHIPHNDLATISQHCMHSDDSIGQCSGSTYYIDINIPDVSCTRCFLKITQIIVDATTPPCHEPNQTCDSFISCANVKIRSSTGVRHLGQQCEAAASHPSNLWPYRLTHIYTANTDDLNLHVTMTSMFHLGYLEFQLINNNHWVIESMEVYHLWGGNYTLIGNLLVGRVSNDAVITGRAMVSTHDLTLILKANTAVKIQTMHSVHWSKVIHIHTLYEPGVYRSQRDIYTEAGWLHGSMFVGRDARFSSVNLPLGPCAPQTYHYIASVSSDTHTGHHDPPRGLLSLTFVDERVHVSGAFHSLATNVTNIVISGNPLAGYNDFVIPGGSVRNNLARSCFSAREYMPFVGTTRFLRTVTVHVWHEKLVGHLQQGMAADIEGPEEFCGVALFQFLVGASLHYSILAYRGDRSLHSVTLNGPARQGMVGHTLATLTPYFYTYRSGWLFGNSTLHIRDSSVLLYLWTRRVYLSLSFNNTSFSRTFSGQLSVPGTWMCDRKLNIFCPVLHLSHDNHSPDGTVASSLPVTNGTVGVAVFLWDRVDVIQYSIWVRGNKAVTVTGGQILAEDRVFFSTNRFSLSHDEDFVSMSHGQLGIRSREFDHKMTSGLLQLRLTTSVRNIGQLTSDIPASNRPTCYETRIKFEVELNSGWVIKDRQLTHLYALLNDSLLLTNSDLDTVYNVSNKESYESCDFNASSLIGQQFELTRVGSYYIASLMTCERRGKFVITVRDGAEPANATFCETPLFERWWQHELLSHSQSNILGAAVGASIIGAIVVVMVAAIDYHVRRTNSNDAFERF